MERTAYDSEDSKKDGKAATPRAPMHVPLGLTSREGGLLSGPTPERPKKDDPLAPLRETVMAHVSNFEHGSRTATEARTEDEDEDDDTVPAPPRPRPTTATEDPVFVDLAADAFVPPPEFLTTEHHATTAEEEAEPASSLPTPPRPRPRMPISRFAARTAGGAQPPRRPPTDGRPPEMAPEPELPPEEPPYQEVWSRPHPPAAETEMPAPAPLVRSERGRSAEYTSLQRELAGVFATSVLLSWYLSHRALRRHDKQNQRDFKAAHAENERLRQEHTELTSNFNRHVEDTDARVDAERRQQASQRTPEAPHQPTAEQIAAMQRQAAELAAERQQPKVHIEQDAWKRYAMVDGKLEKDAIEYGKAFKEEQRAEQIAARIGQQDQAGAPGGGVILSGQQPMLGSGQVDPRFQLPGGSSQPLDPQHLLQPSDGPLMEAARNPWMWVGVGILLLAFFLAAFI